MRQPVGRSVSTFPGGDYWGEKFLTQRKQHQPVEAQMHRNQGKSGLCLPAFASCLCVCLSHSHYCCFGRHPPSSLEPVFSVLPTGVQRSWESEMAMLRHLGQWTEKPPAWRWPWLNHPARIMDADPSHSICIFCEFCPSREELASLHPGGRFLCAFPSPVSYTLTRWVTFSFNPLHPLIFLH